MIDIHNCTYKCCPNTTSYLQQNSYKTLHISQSSKRTPGFTLRCLQVDIGMFVHIIRIKTFIVLGDVGKYTAL